MIVGTIECAPLEMGLRARVFILIVLRVSPSLSLSLYPYPTPALKNLYYNQNSEMTPAGKLIYVTM